MMCRGCAEVFISHLNRPLLKEFVCRVPKHLPIYICQYKPKGVQPDGFLGQFACSWAGADPEIIVSCGGGGSPSLTDLLVVLCLLFTGCSI